MDTVKILGITDSINLSVITTSILSNRNKDISIDDQDSLAECEPVTIELMNDESINLGPFKKRIDKIRKVLKLDKNKANALQN